MTWNYRVFRKEHQVGDEKEVFFEIHEAYYENVDAEIPNGCTVSAVAPWGLTIDDLRWCLNRMLESLDKPVLISMENEGIKEYDE